VRGDTSGALATFKGAQQASPGYAPTYRGLGLVYEKMGNKTAAKLAFKRYLQLSPNASDAEQIKDRVEKLGS
jgi:Flp pilus assembly protein TadD